MVSPTPPDLPGVAQALLTSAAAALGGSAPTRQYRTAGIPAYDFVTGTCDSQLTVMVGPVAPGLAGMGRPGQPETTPNRLRSYSVTLELARSVPVQNNTGGAPSAAVLDAAGVQHMTDFRTLDLWKRSLGWGSKGIPPELSALGVMEVADSTITTVNPQGGMVGIRALVVLVL